MKNNIKVLSICFMALFTGFKASSQVVFVKGGLNLANMLIKDNDINFSDEIELKSRIGFNLGATAEFELSDMFALETGLMFSQQGYKTDYANLVFPDIISGDGASLKEKRNLIYLIIPINAKAYFDLGNLRLYGTFGPYLGMGLYGKTIQNFDYENPAVPDESTSDNIDWGDDLQRTDFGLNLGVGIEIDKLQFGLNYIFGLANNSISSTNGYQRKHRVFQVTAAYKLFEK